MKNNLLQRTVNTVFEKFSSNPSKMLIYTGVLGWFLSSAAQVVAIAVNNNISKEQKSYLIPQEIADGAVNVFSFFLITQSIKAVTSKLVSTGKIISPKVKNYLVEKGFNTKDRIGKVGFDIAEIRNTCQDFEKILPDYNKFKSGTEVIATTLGSILSCNIVTPILRNQIAASRQKTALSEQKTNLNDYKRPQGLSIDQFRNQAYSKYGSPFSSHSLKI